MILHIWVKLKAESRDVGTLMFMAAFFMTDKRRKQPEYPVMGECTMRI